MKRGVCPSQRMRTWCVADRTLDALRRVKSRFKRVGIVAAWTGMVSVACSDLSAPPEPDVAGDTFHIGDAAVDAQIGSESGRPVDAAVDAQLGSGSNTAVDAGVADAGESTAANGERESRCAELVGAQGTPILPWATLTDWVSFGDRIALFRVASETPPYRTNVPEGASDLIGRWVTIEIEEIIWANLAIPLQGSELTMLVAGWVLREGCDEPVPTYAAGAPGGPRLEVGGRYIGALTRFTRDGGSWGPLVPAALLHVQGDPIATADVERTKISEIAQSLVGLSLNELASIFEETERYPLAEENAGRPAEVRWGLVAEAMR